MIRRLLVVVASMLVCVAIVGLPGMAKATEPGSELWATRYDGPPGNEDSAIDVGQSPDGSTVYVTGTSGGAGTADDYATVAYQASTGAQLWERRYDNGGRRDRAGNLDVSPDGSKVFVTGWSGSARSKMDWATVAYNAATGAQIWVMRYTSPRHRYDAPSDIEVSPDGSRVIVTGYTEPDEEADFLTISYDAATGTEVWATRYAPGASASALRISRDGTVLFVTGSTDIAYPTPNSPRVKADMATVAYDASTGVQLWSRIFDGGFTNQDYGIALDLSPDGSTVFVLGQSGGPARQVDYATVAYDASSGVELWVTRYTGFHKGTDRPSGIVASPDGSAVFVTGYGQGRTGVLEYETVAYEAATGAEMWVKHYDGRGDAQARAFAIGVSPDGSRVFVTGGLVESDTDTTSGDVDYATVSYDALTGDTLWSQRYDGSSDDRDYLDFGATGLVVSPDGSRVFVTGASHGAETRKDFATVAYRTD